MATLSSACWDAGQIMYLLCIFITEIVDSVLYTNCDKKFTKERILESCNDDKVGRVPHWTVEKVPT